MTKSTQETGVDENSKGSLDARASETIRNMRIFVKMLSGKSASFEVLASDTVQE